eukprot:9203318-Ditylum_brightwellii.AAC.1
MSHSIDGLVTAATRSTQTHNLDIICRRRKELEDAIQFLEREVFEIEVKLVDADPMHEGLYRRVYDKKSQDIKVKQDELHSVIADIKKQ